MSLRSIVSVLLLMGLISCQTPQSNSLRPGGVMYEVFVRAFADGNADGIGDLKGLTGRLDYLQDLGVRGVWLMPVMKSPSYHKYDVTDYKSIDPEYGTLEDFRTLVTVAHSKGIRIIIDLAINHTSREHPWFRMAVSQPEGPFHDYYVWGRRDSIRKAISTKAYPGMTDNLSQWHTVGNDSTALNYYGFFSSFMPDLNYDNPKVRAEIVDIGRFWLAELGVDGFRLDGARYIFPEERATDTHAFWVWFRNEMEKIKPGVYLVGEVWSDGKGETPFTAPYVTGLHSVFNFDLSRAILGVVQSGLDTIDLVQQYKKAEQGFRKYSDQYLDAPFLTNHDQDRLMSAVGDHPGRARVAAGILLTLPGVPYIYYGEEIGMKGMKPDELIREPFVWDQGSLDAVQTSWEKPAYSTDHTVVPLSTQRTDKQSLYHLYKTLIAYRNGSKAMSSGTLEPTGIGSREVVNMIRTSGEERRWVLHNVSDVEVTLRLTDEVASFRTIDFDPTGTASIRGDELRVPAFTTIILK